MGGYCTYNGLSASKGGPEHSFIRTIWQNAYVQLSLCLSFVICLHVLVKLIWQNTSMCIHIYIYICIHIDVFCQISLTSTCKHITNDKHKESCT